MTNIKGYVVIVFLTMCMVFVLSMFVIKDQYDEELTKLKKDNTFKNRVIEVLLEDRKCECDCEWLENFYDKFHEQVGAFE